MLAQIGVVVANPAAVAQTLGERMLDAAALPSTAWGTHRGRVTTAEYIPRSERV